MKKSILFISLLIPILCFGQLWTIDAGDDFVFCDGDENIQLQGIISNPENDQLSILWQTEFTLGSNTYYAEDFLDSINSLMPTLFTPNLLAAAPKLTFYLTVSDTSGNNHVDSVSVFVSDFGSELEDFQFHINQGDSVVLQISAFGGSLPYTYEWMPNNNILDNTKRNPVVFPNLSTNYSVTITDSNGCVIPEGFCDVNEVYVTPLDITEIQQSNVNWFIKNDHLVIDSDQILNTTVEVFDVCGKPVYSSFNTNNNLNINLSAFEKGVYFLSFNKTVLKFVW